jgi:dihydrofolate reductase
MRIQEPEKGIHMSKVRVAGFGVSLDGFAAGPEQSMTDPLGKRGKDLFQWFFHTRTFLSMVGKEAGSVGDIDDQFASRAMENFGAFILGRNMFGPVRGPWPDDSWKGWWGDDPPYHAPTFILTHYEREPIVMEGGTTFYFVTGGIEEALDRAKQAAGTKDVKIGGGVSTVRQYLQAGLIDSPPRLCARSPRRGRSTLPRTKSPGPWVLGHRPQNFGVRDSPYPGETLAITMTHENPTFGRNSRGPIVRTSQTINLACCRMKSGQKSAERRPTGAVYI